MGYLHAWPGKGVLLMLGACSDQGWEYLHAWSREGVVLLMLGASTGQGLFWGIDYRLLVIFTCTSICRYYGIQN